MSNSLAIAAVTSTLRFVLDRALEREHDGAVGGARVTTLRPAQLTDTALVTTPGINVYLYDVRPNHAWDLTDLPTRHADGSFARRPVAALDLYYLLTCYGEEDSLDAQRLLGRAVLALAVTPVLVRDVVTAAVARYSPQVATDFLAESDLADQLERVRIAPHTQSVEELSKLWATFSTPHLLSQTYVATTVLIEADVAPRRALAVRHRSFTVRAGAHPSLARVVTDPPGGSAAVGDVVVLEGTGLLGLAGQRVRVQVGPVGMGADELTATRIAITVTSAVPAGLHGVSVAHVTPGSAPSPERLTAVSNPVPLVVRPTASVRSGPPDVEVGVDPPVMAGQRAAVMLSRLGPSPDDEPDALTFEFPVQPPGSAPQGAIEIAGDDLPSGEWLVRVQVDGVDSLPELVGDVYRAPALTVP